MTKNKKSFVRIVAIILALIMVLSIVFSILGSSPAQAVTQGQIDALKQKEAELADRQKELQSQINSLQYEQSSAAAKKRVLDEQISITEEEIGLLTDEIATYEILIIEKQAEVEEAQAREDEQWAIYKDNIRAMEEQGSVSYFEIIFDAGDFVDLLSRIDLVDSMMQSDENSYNKLQNARIATQEAKASLEQTKFDLENKKVEQEAKAVVLTEQLAVAQELLDEINASLAAVEAVEAELADELAGIQKDIDDKVAELERQRQAQIAANGSSSQVVGTGSFAWPSAASMRVTSPFGTRFHPVYKTYRTHYGIDIGTGYGTNILAADSGTVITATYSSSYGNYVVISHGSGVTTLYAHMSSLSVSAGQSITKGALVGKSGSTGVSTGPHLHFEVSINGSRVNPLDYFSGYIKAWD